MANTSTTELDLLKSLTTSGGATDTLNIVGTITSTPSGVQHTIVDSGTLSVSNFPASQTVSGTVTANSQFSTRTDTFTASGNGVTVDVSTNPLKYFTIVVKQTGSVSAWDVRLEGSLDNTNFTQILQHTGVTLTGVAVFSGLLAAPSLYFRSRVDSLTLGLGTNVSVTILGTT